MKSHRSIYDTCTLKVKCNSHLQCLLFLVVGVERVLSLERVLHGKFNHDLHYRGVPLVEALLPPTSTTRVLVPSNLSTTAYKGHGVQADSSPLGVVVDGVSNRNPLTCIAEKQMVKGVHWR